MLKLSSYALTLALLNQRVPLTAAACSTISFPGDCTYAAFAGAMSASNCTLAGLFPGKVQAAIEAEVAALCEYDVPVQFVEILGTYQADRRYLAGGGDVVDSEASWDVVTGNLQRFDDNLASKTVIAFPEYAARVKYNQLNGGGNNGYPANMNLETSCALKTVMCCFTDDGEGYQEGDATTDVCRHDLRDSPQSNHIANGWSVFPGGETPAHCVGFTWDETNVDLIGNMMYDVSLRNTLNKGYKKGVPGAPMCGCVEHMPVVETAECRTASLTGVVLNVFTLEGDGLLSASNKATIVYGNCGELDLASQYKANNPANEILIDAHLVGDGGCEANLAEYLEEDQFLIEGANPNRYIQPNATVWEQVIGAGTHFLPPNINPAVADSEFRGLITACLGTKSRHCIIRRTCDSCTSPAHRDIYYKRISNLPPAGTNTTAGQVYFLDLFMNRWASYKNLLGVDFEMYSSYEDAMAGTNKWLFCNYDYSSHPIGFPRDCGPYSYTGDQWNSYASWMPFAYHHGFFVEKA